MDKQEKGQQARPGFLSLLTFGWVNKPIFDAFKRKELSLEALYMPDEHSAEQVSSEFDKAWSEVIAMPRKQTHPLGRTLLRLYGKAFFLGGIFKLMWSALVICGAFYFVKSLLRYVDLKKLKAERDAGNPDIYDPSWTGWVLAAGFTVAAVLWGAFRVPIVVAVAVAGATSRTQTGDVGIAWGSAC
jgi:hypothetical protein